MPLTRFRTEYGLWALIAYVAFVVLGFVDPVAGATWKSDEYLWSHVVTLLRGGYGSDLFPALALRAALVAVPAVLVGWAAQALVVVVRSRVRRGVGFTSRV